MLLRVRSGLAGARTYQEQASFMLGARRLRLGTGLTPGVRRADRLGNGCPFPCPGARRPVAS
jgi:hypothetical protein